jgi:hypothetical protein
MVELRLTFNPHEMPGVLTVKKVIIKNERRITFKLDGETNCEINSSVMCLRLMRNSQIAR